jgi:hypothetical protein
MLSVDLRHCDKLWRERRSRNAIHRASVAVMSTDERRKGPRYNFVAMTEMTEESSASCLAGRVAEISRQGCYVDILNTLPVGTVLKVQILRDSGTFTTPGKIIYVHEQIGMGVVFIDPPPDQLGILDSWLTELSAAAR